MNFSPVVSGVEARKMLASIEAGSLSEIQTSVHSLHNRFTEEQDTAEIERLELLSGLAEYVIQHWEEDSQSTSHYGEMIQSLLLHLGGADTTIFVYPALSQRVH